MTPRRLLFTLLLLCSASPLPALDFDLLVGVNVSVGHSWGKALFDLGDMNIDSIENAGGFVNSIWNQSIDTTRTTSYYPFSIRAAFKPLPNIRVGAFSRAAFPLYSLSYGGFEVRQGVMFEKLCNSLMNGIWLGLEISRDYSMPSFPSWLMTYHPQKRSEGVGIGCSLTKSFRERVFAKVGIVYQFLKTSYGLFGFSPPSIIETEHRISGSMGVGFFIF